MAYKKFIVGILIIIALIGVALLLDYVASRSKNPHNVTPTVLSGEVTYRERIALPAGSTVSVALQDTSRADAPAVTIAETTIVTEGENVPIPFMLTYDAGSINPLATYTLLARIMTGDTLRWINTESIPVLTNGAPMSDVSITLHSAVGTGAEVDSNEDEEMAGEVSVANQSFILDSFNGTKITGTAKYTLSFTDKNISAKFCNTLGGSFTLSGNKIAAPQMISTLMACLTPDNLMTMESTFGKIMAEGATITQTGDTLSIGSGTNVFVYKKAQ
jgi:putative lipoprotein